MSLDEQVLVLALLAIALKLFLWFRKEDVIGVGVDRKDVSR
jgi:hypothetical protein